MINLPPALAARPSSSNDTKLTFVGADIESVIKAVGLYTDTTFVIDPRVKGTINLVSETPVSPHHAFDLLTSALRLQGYAVVMANGYAKVVPEADAKLQVGPVQSSANNAGGDLIVTQIFRVHYESAANLVATLRPLISPNNTISANPGNNTLIITDYADNLKRLEKIIASLDTPATSELDVIPVQHAIASDLAVMANRLLNPGTAAAPGAPAGADINRISLLADPRTNAILLRAPSLAHANLAKSLIAKLDQPTAQPGNVHVVYLKNADAVKLAQVLRNVVSQDAPLPAAASSSSDTPSAGTKGNSTGLLQGAAANTASAAPSGNAGDTGSTSGAGGFIQADQASNTLLITASEPVYRNLRAVIDQLDARRAQVYVESLIVEVTDEVATEFGIQWMALSGNRNSNYRVGGATSFAADSSGAGNNNIVNQGLAIRSNGLPVAPGGGLSIGIFRQIAGSLGLGALAHALEANTGANILSIPTLMTLDNEEAKILVGQNVPFLTGQYTTQASGGSAGLNPFQTVERRDVGIGLRIKPQISEGGTVKMEIHQEASSVDPTSLKNPSGITTNTRKIDTNVLVDDGEIIVLGGLIDDNGSSKVEQVPLLGDIPLIGNLFKYQSRGRKKSNLLVFLRPTIIRNNEQSQNVVADRYDYMRNAQIKMQPTPNLVMPNVNSSILPPLENGRPVGGTLLNSTPRPRIAPDALTTPGTIRPLALPDMPTIQTLPAMPNGAPQILLSPDNTP